jgi:DNA-binding response OmpR family regulator
MELEVVLVPASVMPLARALADVLAREAIRGEIASADVLRQPARPIVYVFLLDPPLAMAFADPITAWASAGERTPGLLGIVEDGGGHEREALLVAGFDDVVTGPPSPRELVARIRAVQRRLRVPVPSDRLRYGAFTLDAVEHVLWVGTLRITLTSIELAVMRALIAARGRPLSRVDLLDVAWGGGDLETTERAVDNVILRIRRKLPHPETLETVRGVGFRLSTL